jgi:hypothetical protein
MKYNEDAIMFAKELRQEGHTRKFSIQDLGRDGWEVREEQDDRVLKQVCYTDWHRVERALSMFNLQIGELEGRGWSA